MTSIAEWVNEVPGRSIVITSGVGNGRVGITGRDRVLGKKAACRVEINGGLFGEVDDDVLGPMIVDEIRRSMERLIYSIKDRN